MQKTTLDLTDFIRKPRKNGKRTERYYALTCGNCGEKYHLRIHDARKAVEENRVCAHCNQIAQSKKGYAACVRKHGEDFTIKFVTEYQLAHPSTTEQQIMAWIDKLGVTYQRQVVVNLGGKSRYIVDFYFDNGKAIEAAGYWHIQKKGAKDEKLASLLNVLFVTDDSVKGQPELTFETIAKFIRS